MRVFDLVIVLLILPLIAIPFLVVAFLVWMQLGRPIFFSQTRMGRRKQEFSVRKFRTMTDARNTNGELLPDEQRQSKLTWLLRRLRLDEMPQVLNILVGEMAIVGPRPLLPETIHRNGADGETRCRVRPGLTGWAQISGNTLLSESEKLALDLWYVKHRSPRLDLQIIFETVKVLVTGEQRNPARLHQATAMSDSRGARGA